MTARWTAPGGWVITLTRLPDGRQIYRVSRWNDWAIGYPHDLEALADLLDRSGVALGDLVEDYSEPAEPDGDDPDCE
jgi:hypothetical protein